MALAGWTTLPSPAMSFHSFMLTDENGSWPLLSLHPLPWQEIRKPRLGERMLRCRISRTFRALQLTPGPQLAEGLRANGCCSRSVRRTVLEDRG